MERQDTGGPDLVTIDDPIVIPPFQPATPEEIERRRIIVERILRRRDRIGPIGICADELLHEAEATR